MFGSFGNGECSKCKGYRVLEVRIYTCTGRFIRSEADIKCEQCDGRGRPKNAMDAYLESQGQQH